MTTDVVTTDVVNALTKRVEQLEYQVSQIQDAASVRPGKPEDLFADKEMLARTFKEILRAHGIDLAPISAKELQKQYKELGLNSNEFSRSIIEMREE